MSVVEVEEQQEGEHLKISNLELRWSVRIFF